MKLLELCLEIHSLNKIQTHQIISSNGCLSAHILLMEVFILIHNTEPLVLRLLKIVYWVIRVTACLCIWFKCLNGVSKRNASVTILKSTTQNPINKPNMRNTFAVAKRTKNHNTVRLLLLLFLLLLHIQYIELSFIVSICLKENNKRRIVFIFSHSPSFFLMFCNNFCMRSIDSIDVVTVISWQWLCCCCCCNLL